MISIIIRKEWSYFVKFYSTVPPIVIVLEVQLSDLSVLLTNKKVLFNFTVQTISELSKDYSSI